MSTRSSELRDARMHSLSPSVLTISLPISPAAPITNILPKAFSSIGFAARMEALRLGRKLAVAPDVRCQAVYAVRTIRPRTCPARRSSRDCCAVASGLVSIGAGLTLPSRASAMSS